MQQPGFPPPVDSSEIRPKRIWFVAATGVAVASFVAGIAMIVYGIFGIVILMDETFGEGETHTARLDADVAIYRATTDADSRVDCTATSADGKPAQLETPGYKFTSTVEDREWHLVRTIRVSAPGDYEIACTGEPGPYAISDVPDVGRFAIGMVSFFVLSGLGTASGVLAIVAGVRRSGHRKRLAEERVRGYRSTT